MAIVDIFIYIKDGYKYRFVATGDNSQYFQFVSPTDQAVDIPVSVIKDIRTKQKDLPKYIQVKYICMVYKISMPFAIKIYEFAIERYLA